MTIRQDDVQRRNVVLLFVLWYKTLSAVFVPALSAVSPGALHLVVLCGRCRFEGICLIILTFWLKQGCNFVRISSVRLPPPLFNPLMALFATSPASLITLEWVTFTNTNEIQSHVSTCRFLLSPVPSGQVCFISLICLSLLLLFYHHIHLCPLPTPPLLPISLSLSIAMFLCDQQTLTLAQAHIILGLLPG